MCARLGSSVVYCIVEMDYSDIGMNRNMGQVRIISGLLRWITLVEIVTS